jgi:hypothetical protein
MTLAAFGAGLGQGLYTALGPYVAEPFTRGVVSGVLAGAATGAMSAAMSGSNPGLGAAYGAVTAAVLAAAVYAGYQLAEWLSATGQAGAAVAEGGRGADQLGQWQGDIPDDMVLRYPTEGPMRARDAWGRGWFGAPREDGLHAGIDTLGEAGSRAVPPFDVKGVPFGRGYDRGLAFAHRSGEYRATNAHRQERAVAQSCDIWQSRNACPRPFRAATEDWWAMAVG